ncbi:MULTISPECIES: threonine/serine exporter family protein [Lactobacillus]|uniref:Threonine/serine exporter n=1 Tax=Lactobacillus xujianguonis TaxID=2495899 RepID=A0A437SVG5_9LACO|nr:MULTISPECIES: threonine/serine exporter family protein [Lactobacillus]RVU70919.1 threonine/serine exporter [Lactobacillus xujianguonis]RVU73551.1 threonine/serine exporter [Lactobacillus xujianguonis]
MPFWLEIIINIAFSYIASVGFALTINVPHRALNLAGISGIVGWMVYWFAARAGMGRMLSNLMGAFIIGILGLIFARIKKCPVTVFNIPALVPLVPGVPAYQAVRALVNGEVFKGEAAILRVAIVTCAIALGILLSTMITEMFYRTKKFYKARKNKL